MSNYIVPASEGRSEYVEKRSSFLGRVKQITSEAEAREYINRIRKENRDARHNCWCYIVKDGAERYSDDGEPQGTAGIPMLEIFRREGVTNVVCVVTRYFGGILLGTGGLFRAYTKAAKDALDAAGTVEIVPHVQLSVSCSYALADRIKNEFPAFSATVTHTAYSETVTMTVSLPEYNVTAFRKRIFDAGNGAVSAEIILQERS